MATIKGSAAVMIAAFLLLGSHAAQAATVEARVPFPFVVRGQTMPAGRYLVSDEGTRGVVEVIGEGSIKAKVFAMGIPAMGHDPAGDKPTLTFTRGETLYRLSGIWASETNGLTIRGK